VGRLSGGELQRVLIARALVQDTDLLLLDEPTASLDSKAGFELYDFLRGVDNNITVILVSHDIGVIHRYVTSIACLNRQLNYHGSSEVTQEMLEEIYGQGVELLEHPHNHRLLHRHEDSHD
jgi:zinc transport system ATP-binding protein